MNGRPALEIELPALSCKRGKEAPTLQQLLRVGGRLAAPGARAGPGPKTDARVLQGRERTWPGALSKKSSRGCSCTWIAKSSSNP